MLSRRSITRTSEEVLYAKTFVFSFLLRNSPCYSYTQRASYVNVNSKWKKDHELDSYDTIFRSYKLKPLINLKNCIARSPNGCIPISDISKRGEQLDVPMKVAAFLRSYPSVFEEFVGPQYNLPWFRLTPKAIEIHEEEMLVYENHKSDLLLRLKKLILMSGGKGVPVRIIKGILWNLGLPEDFLKRPLRNLDESFRFVNLEDGDIAIAVDPGEKLLSVLQKNAMQRGVSNGGPMESIAFPLFPSRAFRLKKKVLVWLREFQKLPYVSPYEDFSHLRRDSDIAEKRVVGVLHELLSLFVGHAAQMKRFIILKKSLQLPQKFDKAFHRHPHIFYLSPMAGKHTVILKEAYRDETIPWHPLEIVRNKYMELMEDSNRIFKEKRSGNRKVCVGSTESGGNRKVCLESTESGGNRKVCVESSESGEGGNPTVCVESTESLGDRKVCVESTESGGGADACSNPNSDSNHSYSDTSSLRRVAYGWHKTRSKRYPRQARIEHEIRRRRVLGKTGPIYFIVGGERSNSRFSGECKRKKFGAYTESQRRYKGKKAVRFLTSVRKR